MRPEPDLPRLVEAYFHGALSSEDFAVLEARLAADPEARRFLRRAANLDSALHAWAARDRTLSSWHTGRIPAPVRRRALAPWLGLAAAVALMGVGSVVWNQRTRTAAIASVTARSLPALEKTAQGSAILTQSAGALWSGSAAPRPGDILSTGALTLARGLVQIEFFSGATLLVEGPAEFEIASPWEVAWSHGKARVHVPPAARGFRLLTPGMKLVDLGTEFGVEVDVATQDVRVAVFSGEVVAHPASGGELSLREGEGIARRGDQISRTAAGRPDEFATGHGLRELRESHARSRFAAWSAASRAQASDPRLIAYYPLTEVDAWSRIVRNAAPDRDLDGGAVGVSTAAGRWPEKPALEFKRPGDRVRIHIRDTVSALTMAGWVKVDGLDRTYNALFLTDGYEAGEPHWQIFEDGRLMFSISYFDERHKRHNQIYYSPVAFDAASAGRWHHVAVTYDSHTGEAVQYLDGRELSREVHPRHAPGRPIVFGPCELGNWGLPTQHHKFPIRNLNGSLDEFALYRAALSSEEIRALYEMGKPE